MPVNRQNPAQAINAALNGPERRDLLATMIALEAEV